MFWRKDNVTEPIQYRRLNVTLGRFRISIIHKTIPKTWIFIRWIHFVPGKREAPMMCYLFYGIFFLHMNSKSSLYQKNWEIFATSKITLSLFLLFKKIFDWNSATANVRGIWVKFYCWRGIFRNFLNSISTVSSYFIMIVVLQCLHIFMQKPIKLELSSISKWLLVTNILHI